MEQVFPPEDEPIEDEFLRSLRAPLPDPAPRVNFMTQVFSDIHLIMGDDIAGGFEDLVSLRENLKCNVKPSRYEPSVALAKLNILEWLDRASFV